MNKIYKVVWNKARNCYVVVSEFAKNHSTSSVTKKKVSIAAILAAGMLSGFSPMVSGAATITDTKTPPKMIGYEQKWDTDTSKGKLSTSIKAYQYQGNSLQLNKLEFISGKNNKGQNALTIRLGAYVDGANKEANIGFVDTNTTNAELSTTIDNKTGEIKSSLKDSDDKTVTSTVNISKYVEGKIADSAAVVYDKNKTSLKSTNSNGVGKNAIALGKGAYAVANSIAIGNGAYTQDGNRENGQSVALGNGAVTGAKSTSIGNNAIGGREGTITIGANANNGAVYATIVGTDSSINYESRNSGAVSTVIGSKNSIKNDKKTYSGVASSILGAANTIENSNGVTIQGTGNTVTGAYKDMNLNISDLLKLYGGDYSVLAEKENGAIAIIGGANTISSQTSSTVIGFGNTLKGKNSAGVFTAGSHNTLTNVSNSLVMGDNNTLEDRKNVISLGNENTVDADDAVAIGNGTTVTAKSGVAIGVGSVAARVAGSEKGALGAFAPDTIPKAEESTWRSTAGAVSVGYTVGNITRQITNVAAGSEATDAVNVAQLKAATENAGWNLSTGKEITNSTKVKAGATVDFSGDDENITVSKEETDFATLVNVKLNRNLNVDSVDAGDYFMSAESGIGFGGESYITQSGLNANDKVITNVAAGVYNTDAVNVGQLKEVEEVAANANKGWNLSTNGVATEATNVAPGEYVDFSGDKNISVSHDGTKVKAELNKDLIGIESISNGDAKMALNGAAGTAGMINGKGASIYMKDGYTVINSKVAFDQNGKISGVAAGTADTDAVNVSQLKNSAWKLAANGVLTEAEDVKADDYVDFNGDQNVSVSKDAKDGVKTVKVELNKDLKDIESISNGDAKMALNGAAGTAGMINGKGASIYMKDGYTVINSKVAFDQNGKISGVAAGVADTDAVNVSQLKAVGATANMGWNLATNGVATEATNVKPGDYVDFSGDKNISVSHDGTKVKVELNKDIDVNSVQTNALNSKYNLSVGTMAENGIMPFFVNSTGDFYAAHNNFSVDKDGKVTATAGEIGNVVLNNGVFTGHSALRDGELFVGDASGNYSQITTKGAKLGKVTIAEDGKISGVAAGEVSSTSTDAINGSQLHQTNEDVAQNKADIAQNKADIAALDNRVTQNEADIKQNKADIAQNKADIQKNTVAIEQNKTDIATNKENINKLDTRVTNVEELAKKHTTVAAGDNITVTEGTNKDGGKNYTVAMKKDITVDSVKAGDTTINTEGVRIGDTTSLKKDSLTIGGKTYVTDKGLNANNQTITNVADGKVEKDSKDAVNGGQLYETNQAIANNATNISSLSHSISNLDNRVNKVGAGAAALAALHPLDFDPDAKWDFAAGYGNYRGTNAAAVGAYYRPNEDTMFSVGGTFGNGENMVNAGVSFKLGSGSSHVSTSRVAMAKEIKELRGELEAMKSAMLDANAGKKIDTSKLQLFPDVPQNHWAYEYVAQLAGNGMIEGYPDGNFAGDRPMTRYEFAAILYRAMTKGAVLSDKILNEFSHELEYFTVDTVAKDKAGNPTIQRVRTVKANTNK